MISTSIPTEGRVHHEALIVIFFEYEPSTSRLTALISPEQQQNDYSVATLLAKVTLQGITQDGNMR
jgi:hypothetical protein